MIDLRLRDVGDGDAALYAISKAGHATAVSVARVILVDVPLAWLGVAMFGYAGILAAALVANGFGAWAILVAARATSLLETDAVPLAGPARRLPA